MNVMERYVCTVPPLPPTHTYTYINMCYIFGSLLILHKFSCFYQSCICLEPAVFGIPVFLGVLQLPERTSKYFKPFQRQHYANEAELEKPLKSFPLGDWWYLMVLCQFPSMTILQSCFVWSESILFAITVNLCLIKKQCTALNLAVYIMEMPKGIIMTWLLSMHNNARKITDLVIARMFEMLEISCLILW